MTAFRPPGVLICSSRSATWSVKPFHRKFPPLTYRQGEPFRVIHQTAAILQGAQLTIHACLAAARRVVAGRSIVLQQRARGMAEELIRRRFVTTPAGTFSSQDDTKQKSIC